MPWIILNEVSSRVPVGMEIAGGSIGQYDFFKIASKISIWIGHIKQSYWM